MSRAELKDLAIKIHRGDVWLGYDKHTCQPFQMLIGLMTKAQIKDILDTKPVAFWEEMRKAAPIQCNGMPIFFSAHALVRGQWAIVRRMLRKLDEAEKAL